METIDLSFPALGICFLLLAIGITASVFFKLNLGKTIFVSVGRMTVQLALIAVFLEYLFTLNNGLLNFCWLFIMIVTAAVTTTRNANLKVSKLLPTILISFFLSTMLIILYLNFFVIRIENIFDAKYIVVLSGMLLGNILRSNIVALGTFYTALQKDRNLYLNKLAFGATLMEAVSHSIRESMLAAFKPSLASMATMGIVALPGMMTGTILGGASPGVAIKYQIMIMIAIFNCIVLSVFFNIFLSIRISFNDYGILREDIFKSG